jgi:hypothetical protein
MLEFARSASRQLLAAILAGFFGAAIAPALAQVTAKENASPPDLSGGNAGWVTVGTDWTAVPGSPAPVTSDPAHPYVPNNTGKQPTFRVADLNNPNLTQFAKDALKKSNDEVLRGKAMYARESRCWATGVPVYLLNPGGPTYWLQTPEKVTMIWQMDHQVRHVYLNVPHSADPKPSWYGESVGHYEGDTLVVDTIALNDKTAVDNYRTPHSEKLHVVERWKMIDDGKTLEVTMRLDDPDTYNEPWSAVRRYRRVQQPMTEEVCAENNAHLFDYHIPVADQPDF